METEIQISPLGENVDIKTLFSSFRETLDQHYDRKERIIKQSRDITGLSKKLIFLAHRATQKSLNSILEEAETKKKEILKLFQQVSCELEGLNYYRYHKSISPAIQEYIEAISFLEYLEHNRLISKDSVDSNFKDRSDKQFLQVLDEDYILGIADLTGELMRYAINCVGKGDHDCALQVCQFLRSLMINYDLLKVPGKSPLSRKLEGMKSNLAKVEEACYALTIRGSEYPKEFYQHIVSEHAKHCDSMEVDE
ncbi:translin-associated protein X-like protein [Glomus cerebriforme]|uniref:Translin-associated protein X-like protein n=1 Tax=Glomus cerebriforme TaxID=658196 RepID=A0A397SLM5_9GLOM|nr:translin-associated protein X-like protein [Glomus cerebriforme]